MMLSSAVGVGGAVLLHESSMKLLNRTMYSGQATAASSEPISSVLI